MRVGEKGSVTVCFLFNVVVLAIVMAEIVILILLGGNKIEEAAVAPLVCLVPAAFEEKCYITCIYSI